MQILITGATGFLGRSVTSECTKNNLNVTCFIRNKTKFQKYFANNSLNYIQGDITSFEDVSNTLQNIDVVVHLAAVKQGINKKDFQNQFQGTKNIVDAMKQKKITRLIYISSLGVCEKSESLYHKTKWQEETYIRNSNLDYTILQPSGIFGTNDGFTDMLMPFTKSPIVPTFNIPGKIQPVWVEDIAKVIVKTLEKTSLSKKTIPLGGQDQVTLSDLINLGVKVRNKKRIRIKIPNLVFNFFLKGLEKFHIVLPITSDQLKTLTRDGICETNDLENEFGIKPKRLEDFLREN